MRERMRVVIAVVCVLSACDTNESGNTSATVMGDVSRQAEKGSPVTTLQAACGSDTTLTLRRQPYMQQVTDSSAMIGWVTTKPMGERVIITRPDGSAVTTAAAIPQNTEQRHP